jgi:hypothetical protein
MDPADDVANQKNDQKQDYHCQQSYLQIKKQYREEED